jgi:4-hydroxy-tetrahydrodipicolinate reductase
MSGTERTTLRVAVAGADGRMGRTTVGAVEGAGPDLDLVAQVDPALGVALADVLGDVDVVIDFTRPDTALANALACVEAGVHCVVGTTGFELEPLKAALTDPVGPGRANVFLVMMMRFAAQAALHMPRAEIIELHHDRKLDAPSGTAARTAELMAEGAGEVPIHSVRLPGLVAHQEVILGGLGETLTIRHDSIDRVAFMPGVLLATRRVAGLPDRLTVGLEHLLFPEE